MWPRPCTTGRREYLTLVRVTVETDGHDALGRRHAVRRLRPRIVEIKGIKVEADFAPHMLYVTNQDKPGFIGRFGATLAGAGINIATFHLGRAEAGRRRDLPGPWTNACRRRAGDGAHAAAGGAGDVAGFLKQEPATFSSSLCGRRSGGGVVPLRTNLQGAMLLHCTVPTDAGWLSALTPMSSRSVRPPIILLLASTGETG